MIFKNSDIVINCVGKIINNQNNIQKANVTFVKNFLIILILIKLKLD